MLNHRTRGLALLLSASALLAGFACLACATAPVATLAPSTTASTMPGTSASRVPSTSASAAPAEATAPGHPRSVLATIAAEPAGPSAQAAAPAQGKIADRTSACAAVLCGEGTQCLVTDAGEAKCVSASKTYKSTTAARCKTMLFRCDGDQKPFVDAVGCGCESSKT